MPLRGAPCTCSLDGVSMARPRKHETARQTHWLSARVTADEKARIAARAAQAGLGESEYVRRMALNGKIDIRRESGPGVAVVSELRRIGNNINQQTILAHVSGEIPPELKRLWAKLETLLDRIIQQSE